SNEMHIGSSKKRRKRLERYRLASCYRNPGIAQALFDDVSFAPGGIEPKRKSAIPVAVMPDKSVDNGIDLVGHSVISGIKQHHVPAQRRRTFHRHLVPCNLDRWQIAL